MQNEINLSIINGSATASSAPADLPEELRQFLMNEAKASILELEPVVQPKKARVRRGSFRIDVPLTIERMMIQAGGTMCPYIQPDRNPSPMEGDVFFRVLVQQHLAHNIVDRLKKGGTLVVEILAHFVPRVKRYLEADLFFVHLSDLAARTDRTEKFLECIDGGANLIAVIWEPAFADASDRAPRMAWCAAYRADVFSLPDGAKTPVSPSDQTKSTRNQIQQEPGSNSPHTAELDVPRNL